PTKVPFSDEMTGMNPMSCSHISFAISPSRMVSPQVTTSLTISSLTFMVPLHVLELARETTQRPDQRDYERFCWLRCSRLGAVSVRGAHFLAGSAQELTGGEQLATPLGRRGKRHPTRDRGPFHAGVSGEACRTHVGFAQPHRSSSRMGCSSRRAR